jgi:predicted metal-dependent phosphoesterase TrpH
VLIDLHTHTAPKSQDSSLAPEALFQRAKELGLEGLCLTEHDDFWEPEALARWSQQFNLLILPGCEVTTEEGHLLVFGLERYIFGMHRAAFVKSLVDAAGAALVVAHPFRGRFRASEARDPKAYARMVERASREPPLGLAHALEALNGRGSPAENAFSHALGQRLALPETGASDTHSLEEVGTCATEFDRSIRGLPDLIRELRAGRCRPVTLRVPEAAGPVR